MKASEADIIFIKSHASSSDDHWQNRWQAKLSSARCVQQSAIHDPVRDDWVGTIARTIQEAEKPVVLVAHSVGVVAAIQAIPLCGDKIAGAFLVSPPDMARPATALHELRKFGAYSREPLTFPSIVVASRNDPHGSYEHAGDIANAWGSLLVDAGQSGHIEPASGHGPWPEGTMVFAQFLSRLKARDRA